MLQSVEIIFAYFTKKKKPRLLLTIMLNLIHTYIVQKLVHKMILI